VWRREHPAAPPTEVIMVNPFKQPNRHQIDQATQGKKSDYAQQVQGVNSLLDKHDVQISSRSKASVIDNVHKVESGQRSEINAHQREAVTFGRDAFVSAKQGNYRQAAAEATGSVLNTFASFGKATYTPTPLEKLGVDPH
jgi:hypothetical protein